MAQKIVHIVLFLQSNAGAPVNNLGKPVNIVVIFKNFMRLPCHYWLKMSLCLSRRRVWGFLFSAVLFHEAEGEFAAVGGGDGEEVGGRGA